MKRLNNLYDQVISQDNIKAAYINARKGKTHYREVKVMDKNPERYICELHRKLSAGEFENSRYTIFKRHTGRKVREIYKLPFFPNRIVHHAIVQVLQPIWMNLLIRDTFSTIPGRGIHDGVKRMKQALKDKRGTTYCLKLDIKKFYPSVDHDVLKAIICRKIKDRRLIDLLGNIIDSADGIPIGNYISQWFGNLYLAYFDHFVKETLQVKYYYRYADDLVILSPSKRHLNSVFSAIKQYLNDELKLQVKENYQIFPTNVRGIDFLGYRFFHDYTLVRKSIVKKFKSKIKKRTAHIQIDSAYWGWFKHADTFRLTQKYFQYER